MNTLTFSTFDNQLEQSNQQLELLQQQIAETKAIKRAIAAKKRLAERAFSKLNQAIEGINLVVENPLVEQFLLIWLSLKNLLA